MGVGRGADQWMIYGTGGCQMFTLIELAEVVSLYIAFVGSIKSLGLGFAKSLTPWHVHLATPFELFSSIPGS